MTAISLVIGGLLVGAIAGHDRAGPRGGVPVVVMLIALAVVTFVEWGAITAARRNGGFRG